MKMNDWTEALWEDITNKYNYYLVGYKYKGQVKYLTSEFLDYKSAWKRWRKLQKRKSSAFITLRITPFDYFDTVIGKTTPSWDLTKKIEEAHFNPDKLSFSLNRGKDE